MCIGRMTGGDVVVTVVCVLGMMVVGVVPGVGCRLLTAPPFLLHTPSDVSRRPKCSEGYRYFRNFMKCDASLAYCYEYDDKSCVGPPNWSCLHSLNRRLGAVSGKNQHTFIKKAGLGNTRCCGGRFQSPISIPTQQASCSPALASIRYLNNNTQLEGVFENNGIHPTFSVRPSKYDHPLILKGVPFTCTVPGSALYVFSSIKVHVGRAGEPGSEHRLQGKAFDGEIQLVHYRRDFWRPSSGSRSAFRRPSTLNTRCASQVPLGITIIAIFLSVTEGESNEELDKFLSAYNVKIIQQSQEICAFDKMCDAADDKAERDRKGAVKPKNGVQRKGRCKEPLLSEDKAAIVLIKRRRAKGDYRYGTGRDFVIVSASRRFNFHGIRDVMSMIRRKRHGNYTHSRRSSRAAGKDGGDDSTRCFCRRRSYEELFLLYAERGEEFRCRQIHYMGLPGPGEKATPKESPPTDSRGRQLLRVRPGQLLPSDPTYYQYFGSLTSPPCSEVVNWIVMKTPLRVSQQQLEAVRQLQSRRGSSVLGEFSNARRLLPLNGRLVSTNHPSC